jgi:hypothetical protein
MYSNRLNKALPRFRVPLAADDRDTVLDLQTAVNRAYDAGQFASFVDYTRDPATKLSDENHAYMVARLIEQKARPTPSRD